MIELSKTYEPNNVEDKIFQQWMNDGYFHQEAEGSDKVYSIVIPPPNVTGVLHMGHALNNTIQDILIRKARMDGLKTRWVVGTDHAGIATQNVVEKKLKKDNLSRHELGREAFLEEVWKWKEEHGSTIINQLKKMGCSCDYSTERFTMDEGLAHAVRVCFVKLYEKNLIYQGPRMIHWCPRCLTALSDEEAEHKEQQGQIYVIKYQVAGESTVIELATTRPETLLGDTAVAVNPGDERVKPLLGKKVIVPFVNREIPVIEDDFVDPEFGTGIVKVTPAHDPNDYEMGLRHHLDMIEVMTDNGIMNYQAGPYEGLDRFECRKKILEDLKEKGQLGEIKDHDMSVRHCYRCDTVVEPKVSKQWFVKMEPLASKALELFKKGYPKFYPERYGNIYLRWLEGIKDWCISRQIWWGHQIPVWTCEDCGEVNVSIEDLKQCRHCQSTQIKQETDVLDTWFSSWLWPFSTLGWPEKTKDLNCFYPTHTLTTAQEIIFFWVARMVMAGVEFLDECPFQNVYIHGTVRDETGLKMSKSFGNVIDPLKIIDKFGADALRFSLMIVAARGSDIYLSDKKFEIGRNFATKIWNATRFVLMNMGDASISVNDFQKFGETLTSDDRLILYKTNEMIQTVDQSIKDYRFNDASLCLYDFFWKSFCDRYIESVKIYFNDDGENKQRTQSVLFYVLTRFLMCVHPFMPYISEEIWSNLKTFDECLNKVLAKEKYPQILHFRNLEQDVILAEGKYELIKAARNIKSDFNIDQMKKTDFIVKTTNEKKAFLEKEKESMKALLKANQIEVVIDYGSQELLPSRTCSLGTVFMKLDREMIDFEGEKKRISKKIEGLSKVLSQKDKKLSNPGFLAKAKKEVIEKEREKYNELKSELNKVQELEKFFR